jgi:hypothetical protein
MSSKNYNDIDKNSLLLGGGMGRGLLFPGSFDPFTKDTPTWWNEPYRFSTR